MFPVKRAVAAAAELRLEPSAVVSYGFRHCLHEQSDLVSVATPCPLNTLRLLGLSPCPSLLRDRPIHLTKTLKHHGRGGGQASR